MKAISSSNKMIPYAPFCRYCHKQIKGKRIVLVNPTIVAALGGLPLEDFHPHCYKKAKARLVEYHDAPIPE